MNNGNTDTYKRIAYKTLVFAYIMYGKHGNPAYFGKNMSTVFTEQFNNYNK